MREQAVIEKITLQTGKYCARLIPAQPNDALNACFRLRYRYFVQERGWVTAEMCQGEVERDRYDDYALHLAVFDGREVLAYVRVLPHRPELGFMLDSEFSPLLDEEERRALPRDRAAELSRLVCQGNLPRRNATESHPLELLLKLLYRVCVEYGFQQFYIVVEDAWLKPFARRFGLPFRILGQPQVFPDSTQTVAATATLAELQESMKQHSLQKYDWYHE